MFTLSVIQDEISKEIHWFESNNGAVLHPDYITDKVMGNHADVKGLDADFALCAARITVRAETRKALNKYKVVDQDDAQIILPGFVRLQRRYLVPRDGEQCAVLLEHLTDNEIMAKVGEMQSMVDGLQEHIRELLRYMDSRRARVA